MKCGKYFWRIATVLLTFAVGVGIVWMFSQYLIPVDVKFEPSKNQPHEFLVSDESYAVFSEVLKNFDWGEQIVISDYAFDETPDKTIDKPHERTHGTIDFELDAASAEVISDYKLNNADRSKLENKFTVPGKIFLLSRQEEDILFPKGGGGWEKFRARFPKGSDRILYLSNVGFNRQKTEALFYMSRQCRICNGSFYRLKKINGIWTHQSTPPKLSHQAVE